MSMSDLLEKTEEEIILFSEMSCQFKHEHKSVPASCRTCLEEVTHLLEASCGPEAIYLCEAAASAARIFIKAGAVTRCRTCKEPPKTHWSVRPI